MMMMMIMLVKYYRILNEIELVFMIMQSPNTTRVCVHANYDLT